MNYNGTPHRINFKEAQFNQPDTHKSQYQVATGNIAINTTVPLSKNWDSAERAYRCLTDI